MSRPIRNTNTDSSGRNARVAIVCFSRSLGGLELSTLRLAKAMKRRGTFTMVIVPPASAMLARAQEMGVDSAALAPRWKYGDIPTAIRLAGILKQNRIDRAILMQSHDIHLASLAAQFFDGVKLVFYQQMDSSHNKRDPMHSWIYSKLSLWVTLTQKMKENVLCFTRMQPSNVMVIPLGTDLERFDPALYSKSESRSLFGLPLEKNIIGILGRLDPGKGQEIIIRALPQLIRLHPDLLLVLAGEETAGEHGYKKHLEDLSHELSIEKNIRFIPFTNDVPRLMSALDVFVLPSFGETFGLVVIEAMALGKPIVATNAGGLPEIILDGETGILVPPRDVNAAACAIEKLLSNDRLRESLGTSARAEALRHFSMDSCVDALLGGLATL